MSIDLATARLMAERGGDLDECRITRRWLRQAIAEIERGRWALAQIRSSGMIDPDTLDLSGTGDALGVPDLGMAV